ncbi:hypothetical protein SAMN04488002_1141 [Litoreibacter janthinus]|uniref:Transposase n=1 Tax=Litoreibacter janthinus TaxID=670154 RepID=A0A1I6GAA8_9RHOB|nr:hypothetical protein SAMN04488002_1141 [Litoreibacter janthinus]
MKGAPFSGYANLHEVFCLIRRATTNRDPEETQAERRTPVDHSTLSNWVTRYASILGEVAHKRKA